jgi:hypothetical protein
VGVLAADPAELPLLEPQYEVIIEKRRIQPIKLTFFIYSTFAPFSNDLINWQY